MPYFIGFIIFIVIIYYFWSYILAIIAGTIAIWALYQLIKKLEKDAEAREAERQRQILIERQKQEAREAARRRYLEDQQARKGQLVQLCDGAVNAFTAIPSELEYAEACLNRAEADFKEGVFAPFWDSIENAMRHLNNCDNQVRLIHSSSQKYGEFRTQYDAEFTPFPISKDAVEKLSTATTTSERLRAIVRVAQRNFQFATIFEQRRTNQILLSGFRTLGEAIDGMGDRISSSIHDLGGQIDCMRFEIRDGFASLDEQVGTMHSELAEGLNSVGTKISEQMAQSTRGLDSSLQSHFKNQMEREERAIEMLDNIQRRRTPFPPKIGDGAY
jgi:hypothetical protein